LRSGAGHHDHDNLADRAASVTAGVHDDIHHDKDHRDDHALTGRNAAPGSPTTRIQIMTKMTSSVRAATGMALIAGIAVLSGCGPAPYSRTTTSEQTTTTTPAPTVSTVTTTTERDSQSK
jgi:hypothetical protein